MPAFSLIAFALLATAVASAACIPIERAPDRVGDSACVKGKVLRVSEAPSGVTFLNFCANYRTCPFTVVVFPRDLRHVGDVRQLAGKEIEISGQIKAYDGRPEIILREPRQLHGALRKLPPLPNEYDVERRGRYSAGKWRHPSSPRQTAKNPRRNSRGAEEPPDASMAQD